MALTLKYQGKQTSNNKNQSTYKETYQGSEAEIDSLVSTLIISTFVQGKGYLTSWRKFNGGGDFYNLEIEYSVQYENGTFNNTDSQVYGKKSAQLTVRNIQMPLQSKSNYLAQWNNYLLGLGDAALPAWAANATNTILTPEQRKQYMWVKSIGQIPTEPDQNGKYWVILQQPSKPGVEYYQLACFVVTETAKYSSASAAGAAISKNINTITSPTQTFGITGGNWKLDQATVQFNGKAWAATSVYTRSGDSAGWDTDLYGTSN